jgi:hypothetical protein
VCPKTLPGFLLALGLDPNLNPYHQTLTTFTTLEGDAEAATVVAARPATPYEVGLLQVVLWVAMGRSGRKLGAGRVSQRGFCICIADGFNGPITWTTVLKYRQPGLHC